MLLPCLLYERLLNGSIAVKTRVCPLALTMDGSTRPRPGEGPPPPGTDLGAAAVDAEALSCTSFILRPEQDGRKLAGSISRTTKGHQILL